jgi:anthranilate synthase component 1
MGERFFVYMQVTRMQNTDKPVMRPIINRAPSLVTVFHELSADMETPVSVFLKLKGKEPAFLLESVERGEQVGRYSFIGANPFLLFESKNGDVSVREATVKDTDLNSSVKSDPLRVLSDLMARYRGHNINGLPGFNGGAVGYLSYDIVRNFEELPSAPPDELGLPESSFMFADTIVIFDHVQNKMMVVANAVIGEDAESARRAAMTKIDEIIERLNRPLPASDQPTYSSSAFDTTQPKTTSNFSKEGFETAVKAAKEYILAGDAFQVVLSQRLQRSTPAPPFSIYRTLRRLNPSPYMFYLDFGKFQLIGSSPEMLVKLNGRQAETRPIAGTRPRGKNESEDTVLKTELQSDSKERAEHLMLVDLGRNDLGKVCNFKTVKVPALMSVEKYSHVMHLVSSVTGEINNNEDAFSLMRACFPAGTVSGAPKVRAMQIIDELETVRRGPYAGAVGYFSFNGDMDTCITIRSIVYKDGRVYFQSGAGIVADSEPEREYRETLSKLEAIQKAVSMAESGQ